MDNNVLPVASSDVIRRRERDGVLLFQVRTDEMFYVSPDAFRLFSLCDATRTVGEIMEHVAAVRGREVTAGEKDGIVHFFDELARRGLVELWG
jgi:hypothetical protein